MSSNGATSSLDYANLAAAAFANRTCSHSGGRSVSAAPRCCAGTDPPIRLYPHSGVERAFSGGSQQGHLRRKISDYSVLLSMVRICGAWQFGGAFAGLFPRPPMAGPPPSLPPYGSGLGRARRRWFPLRPRSPVSHFPSAGSRLPCSPRVGKLTLCVHAVSLQPLRELSSGSSSTQVTDQRQPVCGQRPRS